MKSFGILITVIMSLVFTTIIYGFVLCKLWIWFVVPTFGLQPLTIIQAIGLSYIISFFTGKNNLFKKGNNIDDTEDDNTMAMLVLLFLPLTYSGVVLFIGYLISLFM